MGSIKVTSNYITIIAIKLVSDGAFTSLYSKLSLYMLLWNLLKASEFIGLSISKRIINLTFSNPNGARKRGKQPLRRLNRFEME